MALNNEQIKEEVCQGYTERVEQGGGCGRGDCEAEAHLIDNLGYTPDQLDDVPADAVESAFGCGNPLSCAGVASGDVVLDIGSGAGIDCLIAARKVGDTGKVIGLDMTPAMVERARHNAWEAGVANAEGFDRAGQTSRFAASLCGDDDALSRYAAAPTHPVKACA